jgi:hypothetical protein
VADAFRHARARRIGRPQSRFALYRGM